MTTLITGGLGFIGSHTARAVLDPVVDLPPGRDPDGPGRDSHLDVSRIRRDTGYRPEYRIERGMADHVAWLRAGHDR